MKLHKRLTVLSVILVLFAAAGLAAAAGDGPPYTRTRDVIYGRKAGLALTMDVFRPKAKENGAAIIWLDSGDWASHMERFEPGRRLNDYLDRGYIVLVIGHSSFPIFPLDEIVPDVHRAVRYVRHHAQEYRVDADRLAIIGVSSGGHLAAHVGASGGKGPPFPAPDPLGLGRYDPVERESSRVAAFVSFCGPTDLVNFEAEGKSIIDFHFPKDDLSRNVKIDHIPIVFRNYNRKTVSFSPVTDEAEIGRRLKALSPASLVTADSAPGLLIYGEKDTHVPVRQAEELAERMKAAGVPADLIIRKGIGHDVYQEGDAKVVADWLDKRLAERKPEGK